MSAPRFQRSPLPTQRGFSLLEVLVAIALLAVVAGSALQAFGTAAVTTNRSVTLSELVRVAQSRIARISAAQRVSEGKARGRTDDGIDWSTHTSALPGGSGLLTVTVQTSSNGNGQVVTLQTVVQEGS